MSSSSCCACERGRWVAASVSHINRRLLPIAIAALLTCAGCGASKAGPPLGINARTLPRSPTSHVAVIVMENKAASSIINSTDAPYTDALAHRYGLAEASYAITHPSLPNYMALTSGATDGIAADCWPCTVAAPNIVDQLERAGISWRAYLESMPSACYRGEGAAGYAAKHNPFIHYRDIASSASRCARLVGFSALRSDLRHGTLPSFVWITPNLCDDTHDCGVSAGDRFLARTVPALLRELGPHGFLVVTWDEGVGNGGCCAGAAMGGRIATVVAGPDVRPGARSREPLDHYGILATVERAFGLRRLGAAALPASGTLDPLFRAPPVLRG